MTFSGIETKLINLALNHAAHEGEFANAASMLFRQLRNRGITAQQFTSENGASHSSHRDYESLYRIVQQQNETLNVRNEALISEKHHLQAEIDKLKVQLHAARVSARSSRMPQSPPPIPRRYGEPPPIPKT